MVHHRNGHKLDNTPSNLELMEYRAHLRFHTAEGVAAAAARHRGTGGPGHFNWRPRIERPCVACGQYFTPDTPASKRRTCSKACWRTLAAMFMANTRFQLNHRVVEITPAGVADVFKHGG